MDSDDYILDKDMFKECIQLFESNNIDLLRYNYIAKYRKFYKTHNISIATNIKIEKEEYDEKLNDKLLNSSDFSNVWNMMVKRKIIEGKYFKTNLTFGEDFLFSLECLESSNAFLYSDKIYYCYNCVNDESITKKVTNEKIRKRLENIIDYSNIIYEKNIINKGYIEGLNKRFKYDVEDTILSCIEYMDYCRYRDIIDWYNKLDKNKVIDVLDYNVKKMNILCFYINKLNIKLKKIIKKVMIHLKINYDKKIKYMVEEK